MSSFRDKRSQPPRRPPAAGGERVRRKPIGFASFLSRQVVLFAFVAIALCAIDLVVGLIIMMGEQGVADDASRARGATISACDALSRNSEGAYVLDPNGEYALDESGAAWAALVSPEGDIVWSRDLPDDVPSALSASDLAMAGHFATLSDYPVFFYTRDDGLFIAAWPKQSYWHMALNLPAESALRIPLYVLAVFLIDAVVLFLFYAVAKRRTQRAVEPATRALDELSQGRAAEVRLRGDLAEVGDRITEVSRLIERKDEARSMWIRGVSHDIRTPLSMVVGLADAIAAREDAPADVRAQAETIRAQGMRIGDLVSDLNTAAQLDYDARPKHVERISLARVVREACTEHVNAGFGERFPISCDIAPDAGGALVKGDERMLRRAVDNLLANARTHNELGCEIAASLIVRPEKNARNQGKLFLVRISDTGRGATAERIAALKARIAHAQEAGTVAAAYGEEHGLGLVLVSRICRAHGGTFDFAASENGFIAEMTLPACDE